MDWYAARVLPTAELRVQKHLRQLGVMSLVPVEVSPLPRGSRTNRKASKRRPVPILPGYVVLEADAQRFAAIKGQVNDWAETVLLYGLIGFGGTPARLSPEDIEFILDLAGTVASRAAVSQIHVGGRLRVLNGPWQGHTGPVLRVGRERVKTMMSLFGRMTVVSLPVQDVEAA